MEVFGLGLKIQEQGAATVEASIKRLGAELAKTALAVAGLGATMSKFVDSTSEAQYASAQLNAMLNATQMQAGQTAAGLEAQASSIQKLTTYGDDAVVEMQALLLTFHNIRGAIFTDAVPAITDMAAALQMDLSSAAFAVGKALQDPAEGLAALSRLGIRFNEEQKKLIENLVATGRAADAQRIILDELTSRYQGAAAAARNTLGGALKALDESFGNLFELSSETTSGVVKLINKVTALFDALNESMDVLKDAAIVLAGVLAAVFSSTLLASAASFLRTIRALTAAYMIAASGAGTFGGALVLLQGVMATTTSVASTMWAAIGGPFGAAVAAIVIAGGAAIKEMDDIIKIYDDIDKNNAEFDARRRAAAAKKKQEEEDAAAQRLKAAREAAAAEMKIEYERFSEYSSLAARRAGEEYKAQREREERQRAQDAARQRNSSTTTLSLATRLSAQGAFEPQLALGSLDKDLAATIAQINDAVNSPELAAQMQQVRFDTLKEGMADGVSGAIEDGFTSGLTAALQTGRIGELFKAMGQTMVQQIASMMVDVALTFIKFASMIARIKSFLIANPVAAVLAAAAMLTLAHSLGGGTKGGDVVGAGGASGYTTAMMPRGMNTTTQLTFGTTSANLASSMTAAQPMTFNIIGTNDPAAQRAIQEMVSKANRRGGV